MTLTPRDIEQQVFRERRRGYDPEEVDRFLDDVSASIAELMRERDRAAERLAELERSTEATRESETLLRRTLLTAERTAEQTVVDARAEADQLLEEARREASDLLDSAREEASELRRSAEEHAAELRRAAEEEVAQERAYAKTGADHVRRAIAELRDFREEYRDRVQGVIAEQLAALDRVGDLPEISAGLERIAQLPPGTDGEDDPGAAPR